MHEGSDSTLYVAADSLIGWWRDAGVDVVIDEVPRNWLTVESAPSLGDAARAATPAAATASEASQLPTTLTEFIEWWKSDISTLGEHPLRHRVAPEGDPASGLMIIADAPEAGDVDANRLFAGDYGKQLDRMLRAIDRDRSTIWLATVVPARPAVGGVGAAVAERMSAIVRHHIGLVRPARLWLLGDAASRAVLGTDVLSASGKLHKLNHDGATTDAIATLHPRMLLGDPKRTAKARAKVWADMQLLMGLS